MFTQLLYYSILIVLIFINVSFSNNNGCGSSSPRCCVSQCAGNIHCQRECMLRRSASSPCQQSNCNPQIKNEIERLTQSPLRTVTQPIHQTFASNVKCAKDYIWDGSICRKTISINTNCTSPSGAALSNGLCKFIEKPLCEKNEIYDNRTGHCVVEANLKKICDHNYELINNKCVHRIVLKCPPNYQLINNGQCESIKDGHCPMGSHVTADKGIDKCVHKVYTNSKCPSGYHLLNGNECVRYLQGCPENYMYRDGKCISFITDNPIYDCPRNSTFIGRNNCRSTIPTCPYGYKYENNVCINDQFQCPVGYHLENTNECIKYNQKQSIISSPPCSAMSNAPICPENTYYKDGLCYP